MSEKLESLIKRMLEDPSSERVAFKTLGERDDRAKFLEPLKKAGLFHPSRNPGPRPAEQKGFVVIPFWPALEYLAKVADGSALAQNPKQAEVLLQILKDVTAWRADDGQPVDNYHTWRSFAEILASLPTNLLSVETLGMLDVWLSSGFDNGLIADVIGNRLLPTVLASSLPDKCRLAQNIVRAVTKLQKRRSRVRDKDDENLGAVVDAYHLRELFERNAEQLGKLCGTGIATVLVDRTREIWEQDKAYQSYWRRPAIEEHEQNKHRDELFNCITSALRDITLSLVAVNLDEGRGLVANMLRSDVPLHRRIALHVTDVKYEAFRSLFWAFLSKPAFLDLEIRHELYWLLRNNFKHFTKKQQERLISYIRSVRTPKRKGVSATDKARLDLRIQRDWFHAIAGQGSEEIDQQYRKLVDAVGPTGKHPDLLSYVETRSGPGPSPFNIERLLSEECPDLVLLLNGFREQKGWETPTLRALVHVLQDGVSQRPEKFIECFKHFAELRIPYKYAVVEGLRKAFQGPGYKGSAREVVNFIRREVRGKQIWDEAKEVDPEAAGLMNPTIDWFMSAGADFIADVVKRDEMPLEEGVAQAAIEILDTMLKRLVPETSTDDSNPLDRAINTARGRAVEAIFGCALRVARDNTKNGLPHEPAWLMIQEVVDREVRKAKNGGNPEFIAIAGSMIPQLHYLSKEWLSRNIKRIFDMEAPETFRAAIAGFSYVNHFQRDVFLLLRQHGMFAHAMRQQFKESHVREKILQFVGTAYLHGDEDLQNAESLFRGMIDAAQEEDLVEVTAFFWAQRGSLATDKQLVDRILLYWAYCAELLRGRESEFPRLFSKLCLLAEYLPSLAEDNVGLLLQAAPYVDEDYNGTFLLQELHRLIPTNPNLGGQVVRAMFTKYRPTYEDKDVIRLVQVLYESGQKNVADQICNVMNEFPTIRRLYLERNP